MEGNARRAAFERVGAHHLTRAESLTEELRRLACVRKVAHGPLSVLDPKAVLPKGHRSAWSGVFPPPAVLEGNEFPKLL